MELSIESSCQHVTWKVRNFFQLPSEVDYSLDSAEFLFAGDSYRLRVFPKCNLDTSDTASIALKLVRLTSTFPERKVFFKFGFRLRGVRGRESHLYFRHPNSPNNSYITRSALQNKRDIYVPDGTFTVLCYMRLEEQSSAGNPHSKEVETSDTKEEQKGLTGQSEFFSCHWWSLKMELLIESPCQNVTWKVPDFFQLLSKIGYSLNSPEFSFAGDRYCLRFYPKEDMNADKTHPDLQLVRLTSTYPERIVLYKVGYSCRDAKGWKRDIYAYSRTLTDEFGFCFSLSYIKANQQLYVENGTLTVLCSMRVKEKNIEESPQSEEAGESHAEEKSEVLPESSNAVQTEVSDSPIDKRNLNDEDWSSLDTKDLTLLSKRMEDLLNKGRDYDVTICVQNKKFRAHRIILSARSPVFAMMLAHDTKENNTGTISIEDCDPDSFDEFLLYVYSGKTENLTPSRALHIYYAADKYDFPGLKERCVRVLKTSLSVMSICDVVLLAAKHREKELLEAASEFFALNIDEILITVGWQTFLSQNPVEANELYIKSIKFFRPEK